MRKNRWIYILIIGLGVWKNAHAFTHYVDINSSTPISPYSSFATAATNIQAAVDAAHEGDVVLVSNGVYKSTSSIVITNAITIKSVNGANYTIVDGGGMHRCFSAYVNKNSLVEGFTIQNGKSEFGGGFFSSNLNLIVQNCIFIKNKATYGGGMYNGFVRNCSFIKNEASSTGGGMCQGTANNCSFIRNTSNESGGGTYQTEVNNCIIWYNTSINTDDNNFLGVHAVSSCMPDLFSLNCITNNPEMASFDHISSISPCILRGDPSISEGVDIDGESWEYTAPSIGCDEYNQSTTRDLVLSLDPLKTAIVNNPAKIEYYVLGACSRFLINLGDGTILTNQLKSVSHTWSLPGTYNVVLTAYSKSYPLGLSVTQQVSVVNCLKQYVSPTGNDANDGLTWATAKKTIQSAVHNVHSNGTVFVTNGIYALSSEIVVDKPIFIKGMNGSAETIVDAQENGRCFNLGDVSCRIDGFTIMHGFVSGNQDGGGVCCMNTNSIISNCKIISNVSKKDGGGIYKGTAINCSFIDNFAVEKGGGIFQGIVKNSIFWNNQTDSQGDNLYSSVAFYCCSPDGVTNGVDGCITNTPSFVDESNHDYHLKADSPCLDCGNNLYVLGATSLEGNARIINGIVDIGCYEKPLNDEDHDKLPDRWEVRYFKTSTGADPRDDSDNDHQNNLAEYITGTNPTNAASYFYITSITTKTNQSSITWEPVIQARTYSVFWSGNLTTNFTATSSSLYYPQNTYTDTVHHVEDKGFYRVKVEK